MGIAVLVNLICKDGQRPQGDAVTCLNDIQIIIMNGVGQHRCHQSPGAGSSTHPEDVVIAPLDVYRMVRQQLIHHHVGSGAAVKDVAHNVQMIHSQPLDGLTDAFNDAGGLPRLNDGIDDVLIIIPLIRVIGADLQQLIDDSVIALGQRLANLGSGILGSNPAAKLNQPMKRDAIPLIQILLLLGHQRQLLLRVIDQRRQFIPVMAGHTGVKKLVQLFLDVAGAGIEDMLECFIFAMDIGNKMLRSLGQIQNGL